MARTSRRTPVAPIVPVAPAHEIQTPSWFTQDRVWVNATTISVHGITTSAHHVPAFQRGVVWTPEMQAAFCNSVMAGLPVAMSLVWNRYVPGVGNRAIVLDGQQRITALGGQIIRADGTENPVPQIYFDPETGRWGTDPGRWALTPRDLVNLNGSEYFRRLREFPDGSEEQRLWEALYFGRDMFQWRTVPVYVIDARASEEFVVEAFRTINRPGVQFDEAEVERLIKSAMEVK